MTLRPVLCTIAALLQFFSNHSPAKELSAAPPNIIFILADDMGYGDLGCFGQKKIKTPSLDQMASEGIRFTSAYAGSTVCAPSRCTLMTGLHTGHARIRGNGNGGIEPEDVTIAELLKKVGYHTGLIGKWGLGTENQPGAPNKKGFDEAFGYLNQTHAHDYYPEYLLKNGEKFFLKGNANGGRKEYSHDLFAAAALEFLEKNRSHQFFLYLPFTIPHAHIDPPSDEPYSKENWPPAERKYAAMITRLDRDIGRLFAKLKELGLDDNTIVFFTSDNGPHHEGGGDPTFFKSAGPLRGIKRDLYEGGIREPSIVRWPGKIKAGVTSDFPWAFWDFLPTACDVAKIKAPEKIDGTSILPTLFGQIQTPHEFLYWEFHEGGSRQAVRMSDWKAVRPVGEKLELYNLKNDFGETHDVSAQHPDIVAKIENYLKTARTESAQWKLKPPGDKLKKKKK